MQDKTLERIAQRYAPYLRARGLGDIDDARQEVLIAWEQCKDLEYSYRKTRDFVCDTLRKYNGMGRKYQGFEGTFLRVEYTNDDGDVCELVGEEDDRTNSDVDELLAKLPDKYREIYERRLRRESHKEIADSLGLTLPAVYYRMHLARLIMADYLKLFRERNRKRSRAHYVVNRERYLERARKSYAENPEKHRRRSREYYASHKDEMLQSMHERYVRKRDEIHKRASEYYFANKEKINARKREYDKEHIEEKRERQRRYYAKHREKLREKRRLRYAKEKENAGKHNLGLASRSVDGVLPSAKRINDDGLGASATNRRNLYGSDSITLRTLPATLSAR